MKRILKRFMPQTILLVLVAVFAVAAVSVFAAVNGSTDNKVDLSLVMTPETQLTVYVDGQYSGALSDSYGFGDTATITAPEVSGKTFSHWEADGSIISYSNPLKLTMNAHTTLYAVYTSTAETEKPVSGFTSITRTNEGDKISFQAIAGGGTVERAGIVYSTTASGETLKIGGTGVTNVEAVKSADLGNKLPDSVLDDNNCWMLQITPGGDSTVYHARTYVTVGGNTTYGDMKDVKLSELESGISMIANLEGFEPGTDDLLEEIAKNRANNPASVTNAPTAKNLTYNGSAQELVTAGTATGGEMQYALSTDATTAPANNLYTTSIPTATDAGTYYVWYKVVGDENHTYTEAACIPVTVAKKAVTVTAADQTVKLNEGIDTTVSKATLTGAVEGAVLTAVTLTAGSTQAVTTQGTITASAATIKTADGEEDVTANYEITYQTGKLTVEKVPVTITTQPVAGNRSYDGTTQSLLSSAGVADGGTIVYALGDNAQTAPAEGYSTTIPTAVNPGTYYVWCDVAEDGNHEAIEPFCITVEVAVSGIMGDVNGDGIVDIADALMISRYDVELVTLNKNQLALGDITGDGSVDIADALYISRLDAGLLEE